MNKKMLAAPFVFTALLSSGADAEPTAKKLPKAEHPERVYKSGTSCYEPPEMPSCPPGVHCNPGPSHEVECPPAEKPAKK